YIGRIDDDHICTNRLEFRHELWPPDDVYRLQATAFANPITHRPTPELAEFCTTHSPGFKLTYSLSSSAAVGGLIVSIDNCCGSAAVGKAKRPSAELTMSSLQVKLESGAKTRSPTLTFSTLGPTVRTRPTPSLPMTVG